MILIFFNRAKLHYFILMSKQFLFFCIAKKKSAPLLGEADMNEDIPLLITDVSVVHAFQDAMNAVFPFGRR